MAPEARDPTVEEILAGAAEAGLPITEDEARQLQPGVRRIRMMAEEVRALVTRDVEPAGPEVSPMPPGTRPAGGR
jgi:hypothetical protein